MGHGVELGFALFGSREGTEGFCFMQNAVLQFDIPKVHFECTGR